MTASNMTSSPSLPFNMTTEEFLELRMGPQHISLAVVIPITVLYVIIFVTGVIGNVVVCMVIARNSHFQTPTNYYLCSLAISDLLILLCGLPNDLKVYWQQYPYVFGETVCKVRALVAEMTSYASVLTITAFTVERYVAICHPLLIQTVSTLSRAIKLIAAVWIVSYLCAIPFAYFTKINYIEYPDGSGVILQESAFCALPMENNDVSLPLLQFSTFVFFCLPMTLIVILYVKIGLKVRDSRFSRITSKDSGGKGESRQHSPRRSIHKMLVAVVIAFFVCWAPFHAQRLLVVYVKPQQWTRGLRILNEVLFYIAGCLYYFSATINPILYSLMSAKYREAFRETLCSFSSKRDPKEALLGTPRHHSENRSVTERGGSKINGCLPSPAPSCNEPSSRDPSPMGNSRAPRWPTPDAKSSNTLQVSSANSAIYRKGEPEVVDKTAAMSSYAWTDRTNTPDPLLGNDTKEDSTVPNTMKDTVNGSVVITTCRQQPVRDAVVDTWVTNGHQNKTSVVTSAPEKCGSEAFV